MNTTAADSLCGIGFINKIKFFLLFANAFHSKYYICLPASETRLSLYLQIKNFRSRFYFSNKLNLVHLKEKIYPYFLATIQLSCLIFLLVSAPSIAQDYGGLLVECAGLFLGLLAVFQMGIGNFNITPRIKENGVLVTSGIYSIIRHPMYLAQLVLLLPLLIDYFSYLRLVVWLLLFIVLFFKMSYEEKSLKIHFGGYSAYVKRTKKLIPFIY